MTWIIIGLILTIVHILLLKKATCIRTYDSLIANDVLYYYNNQWTKDETPKIPYWIAFVVFLICSIPYLGIILSICFWVGVFISSLINTRERRVACSLKVLVFQIPTITNFLTKKI